MRFSTLAVLVFLVGCGDDSGTKPSDAGAGETCGDGVVTATEECDDSNAQAADGCENDCTFSCVSTDPLRNCTPADPCAGQGTCDDANHTCTSGTQRPDNESCGNANGYCNAGVCTQPDCGNGEQEPGEECDFGTGNNTADSGCEPNCQFTCDMTSGACTDGNACDGTESCTAVTVNGHPGQRCTTTTSLDDGATCGTDQICLSQLCAQSTCGDGFENAADNEECEPPSTATCDANCQDIVCGDSARAGAEQCDDGNTTNLDGCDSACKFEQCLRMDSLSLSNSQTDTYCTANRFGAALSGSLVVNQFNASLTASVTNGGTTIELKAYNLDDLSGTSDPSLSLGLLSGSPVTPGSVAYDGTNAVDWWYTTSLDVIDGQRAPLTLIPAAISAKSLTTTPTDMSLRILGSATPPFVLRSAKLQTTVGDVSLPRTATNNMPPGHLASETLDPTLTSFETTTAGKLCGNVTAASLAAIPIPATFAGGGVGACSQGYAVTNSMLDLIVGGCTLFGQPQVVASQPDGGGYTLQANASKVVTTCRDSNNTVVPLGQCLPVATYSSFFLFTTERVIAK